MPTISAKFVDRIASDIGSTSDIISRQSQTNNSGWFDPRADDRFWFAYGQLYGYYGILTAAHADFHEVIAQRGLTQLWAELEEQLRASLNMQPGAESGWLIPAHLATLGFYVLRVRSNLVEDPRAKTVTPRRSRQALPSTPNAGRATMQMTMTCI